MRLRGSDARWARRSHTSLRPKAKFPEFRGGQAVQGGGEKWGFWPEESGGTDWRWGERTSEEKKMSSARQR